MGRKSGGRTSAPAGLDIALALRSRRRVLGLTLRELAAASGLSVAFLSQAERARTVPSDVSLAALAAAMDVDIAYFLAPAGPVVRRPVPAASHGIDQARLTPDRPDRRLDATLVTLPPDHYLTAVPHDGDSFYHLVDGHVRIRLDDADHDLAPGDSLHCDGRAPHGLRNIGDGPARILHVGTR